MSNLQNREDREGLKELIDYIADILNIKISSPLTVADMTEEINKVYDLAEYRRYLRDNFKHIDTDYSTGFQKFIILTNKFKKIEEDLAIQRAGQDTKGEALAKSINDRMVKILSYLDDNPEHLISRIKVNGEPLFTHSELRLIRSVGSQGLIVEYTKMKYLTRLLYENYIKGIRKHLNTQNQITGAPEVMKIARKAL